MIAHIVGAPQIVNKTGDKGTFQRKFWKTLQKSQKIFDFDLGAPRKSKREGFEEQRKGQRSL